MRRLRRRSLSNETFSTPSTQTVSSSVEAEESLEKSLLGIPGVGSTVAARVVEVCRNSRSVLEGMPVETLAESVQGLSLAGAKKIKGALFGTPDLPTLGASTSTQADPPTGAEESPKHPFSLASLPEKPQAHTQAPAADSVEEEEEEEVVQELPDFLASMEVGMLEKMIPTLAPDMQKLVLEKIKKEKAEKEKVYTKEDLPEYLQVLTIPQLKSLAPSLQGEAKEIVLYLVSNEGSSEVEDTNPVTEKFEPGPAFTTENTNVNMESPTAVKQESSLAKTVGYSSSSILDAFRKASFSSSGSRISYIKLNANKNVLRLLPGEPLYLEFKYHVYVQNSKRTFALDFNWLRNQPKMLEVLTNSGALSQREIAVMKDLGDPFTTLGWSMIEQGEGEAKEAVKSMRLLPSVRCLWNAVARQDGGDVVGIFESSNTFRDSLATFDKQGNLIGGLLSLYPNLFDLETGHDININGNSKDGRARRYGPPLPFPQGSKALRKGGDFSPLDLYKVAAKKYLSYKQKVVDFWTMYEEQAVSVGMSKNDWMKEILNL